MCRFHGEESWKFFEGKIPFDCPKCPIGRMGEFCSKSHEIASLFGNKTLDLICYGAFVTWLFSGENKIDAPIIFTAEKGDYEYLDDLLKPASRGGVSHAK